jgi:hypothetical protein
MQAAKKNPSDPDAVVTADAGAVLVAGAFHPVGLSDGNRVTPILRCTTYINVAITLDHHHGEGLISLCRRNPGTSLVNPPP